MNITVKKLIELGFEQPEPDYDPNLWMIAIDDNCIENDFQTQCTCIEVDLDLKLVSLSIYTEGGDNELQYLHLKKIKTNEGLELFLNLITK